MPVTVEILTIPIGSQLTVTLSGNDTEDKNDFDVLLIFSGNVKLAQSGVSVSSGSIVAFEGANSVYKVTIRPPQTSGLVTVTVNQNAVSEGNAETSKAISVTKFFPDADAEVPTLLFTHNLSYSWSHQNSSGAIGRGIAVSPSRIIISSSGVRGYPSDRNDSYLDFFTHSGVQKSAETLTDNVSGATSSPVRKVYNIDYLNGSIIFGGGGGSFQRTIGGALDASSGAHSVITHTRLGVALPQSSTSIRFQPYAVSDAEEAVTLDFIFDFTNQLRDIHGAAHQNDLIYIYDNNPNKSETFPGVSFLVLHITEEDTLEILANLNIERASSTSTWRDLAIYRDTLYLLDSVGVYTVDIKKYRPLAKNTKTTIYPIFAESGDTIDLTQFSPDAERIVFDVGFEKPSYLSIDTSNHLVVGSGAHTCFVKLKAINRIGATETGSFGFYLIVRQAAAPVWRDVSALTMRAGSSYDLFPLVPDADSIAFRSGRTQLAGSSVSNGVFTVDTVGGIAAFTAQRGGLRSHIAIAIDVVQGTGSERADVSGYRVEIAGIDVTPDVVGFPSVSETLDPIVINEYRVNEASIVLRNKGGKYNSTLAGNFWETNGLNAGGFQNSVKIWTQHSDGSETLHFSGAINESFEPIREVTFKLNCVDISSRLRKALVQSFGTLEKWDALRKQSDEDSFEGIYVPEGSLVPMQIGTGQARSDRTDVDISRLALPSEGPVAANTGYLTPADFRTAGGFLEENPVLGFMAEHRSEDVRFLIHQLSINKEVYNTEIDIPGVEVEEPFLLNRGSVAFSVEQTRTTRVPVDWVHDSTNDRVLILLSNPERHIADVLVQYDVAGDRYRVLHTFDKGIAVHRIERRSGTHYYLLTSAKIAQDRSAGQLPRHTDVTGSVYDSFAEGSEIKIYHYTTSTGTLTEHVAEDDAYPPQVGIHYWLGFENALYIDTFEGIRPDYRGAFKWHSDHLYYRYAKDGEFGVARVSIDGTTTQLMGETRVIDNNHLNFAFDVTDAGDVYMACHCSVPLAAVTVVASTSVPGTITVADDLSSYSIPLLLEINLVSVRVRTNASITLKGTDANGDPHTQQIQVGSDGTRTITLEPYFSTVTSVTYYNLFQGSFSITTVATSFPAFVIKRQTSGGVGSTPLMDTRTLGDLTDLDAAGGVHLGIHECVFHANHLYILAQIGRVAVEGDSTVSWSRQKAAGMVLYKSDVTAASPSLTVIETWDFVTHSACNLTVHNGAVHFVEHPPTATRFKPINPDV